jgi:SAM-dependent methyltransferase
MALACTTADNPEFGPQQVGCFMAIREFVTSQMRKPSGWLGALVACRLMNFGNRPLIRLTLSLLELSPEHHVLEIGFGGCSALSRLVKFLTNGVDFSPDVVRLAERRFHREIAEGRIHIELGDVTCLPFPDAAFDRVFTVNTIYFWPGALKGLSEIRRVLKDDGLAAVSLRSKENMQRFDMSKNNFQLYSPEDVSDLMRQAGFCNVRADHRNPNRLFDNLVVVGKKRGRIPIS